MATVPTPFDATTNQLLTASQWDSQVRDVLLWLMGNGTNGVFPRCHVHDTTGVSVPNTSVLTLIPFSGETYDTDSMHDNTTNPSRITFTTAGIYEVSVMVSLPNATYTQLDMRLTLNANGVASGGSTIRTQPYLGGYPTAGPFVFTRSFNAGDYIEVFISQASGAARTTTNTSLGTRVFARWIAVS